MLMGSLCAHLGAEVEVPGLVAAAKEERAGGGAGPLACREVEAQGEGRNTTRRKINKLKLRLGRHSGVLPLTTPWPASHPASWGPEPAGTHPPAALPGDAAERRGRVPPRCRAPPAAAAPQGWGAGAARHAPPTPAAAPRPAPGWQGVTAGGGGLGSSKRTAGPLESNAPCMPSMGHSGAARWLGPGSPALPPRAPSSHGATPQGAQPACEGCSPASQEVQTPRRRRLKGVAHSTMATASWARRGCARSDEAMLKKRGLRRGAACSGPGAGGGSAVWLTACQNASIATFTEQADGKWGHAKRGVSVECPTCSNHSSGTCADLKSASTSSAVRPAGGWGQGTQGACSGTRARSGAAGCAPPGAAAGAAGAVTCAKVNAAAHAACQQAASQDGRAPTNAASAHGRPRSAPALLNAAHWRAPLAELRGATLTLPLVVFVQVVPPLGSGEVGQPLHLQLLAGKLVQHLPQHGGGAGSVGAPRAQHRPRCPVGCGEATLKPATARQCSAAPETRAASTPSSCARL